MLNKQGKGKIDWCNWSWNPISGCKHGCNYCYIKTMDNRFKSNIMTPAWHPERLNDIESKKLKDGDKVFVGSSGDMWGDWVEQETISTVLFKTFDRDLIFQFLTKNPKRYSDFHLNDMENCWFGTSEDGSFETLENHKVLVDSLPDTAIKFVSFEPLLRAPTISSKFNDLDWIIIGADSTPGAEKPPNKWADFLIENARENNIPVWVKDNYKYPETIKEFREMK